MVRIDYLAKKYTLTWILSIILRSTNIFLLSTPIAIADQYTRENSACILPPMKAIIDESLMILPRSLTDYNALKKQMQRSVWLPVLSLQYGNNSAVNSGDDRTDGRIVLTWNFSQFLFHSQETDAIALYQRTKENEINLRNQIASDYANINQYINQYIKGNARAGQYAEAMKSATKIDALTDNRFELENLLLYHCPSKGE